jgi:DNA-binding transcriptional LysR family regulator
VALRLRSKSVAMPRKKALPKGIAETVAVNPISIGWALVIADRLSFRAAAKELGVRHASVSRRLRELEDSLGTTLFERTRHGLKITHAGATFIQQAREAFQQLQQASKIAAKAGRGETGRLSIGIQPSVGAGFLRELLRAYSEKYSDVTVEFIEGVPPAELVARMQDRKLDVAFVHESARAPDYDIVPLWQERLFVALPAGHRLEDRTAVGWPALRNEHFIISRANCDPELCERVIRHLSQHTPGSIIEKLNVSCDTLMHLVGIRRGLSITSEAAVSTSYPDVIFRPISGEDAMVRFSAVSLRSNGNPALRRLLSLAKARAKRERTNATPTPNAHRSGKWSFTLSLALLGALSRRLGLST